MYTFHKWKVLPMQRDVLGLGGRKTLHALNFASGSALVMLMNSRDSHNEIARASLSISATGTGCGRGSLIAFGAHSPLDNTAVLVCIARAF